MTKKIFRKLSIIMVAAVLVTSCPLSTLAIDEAEMVELVRQESEQEGLQEGEAAPGEISTEGVTGNETEVTQGQPADNSGDADNVDVEQNDTENFFENIVDNIGGSIADIVNGGQEEINVADKVTAEPESTVVTGPASETVIKIDDEVPAVNEGPAANEADAEEATPNEYKAIELTSDPVDGVIVTVSAPEGAIPEDAKLVVSKVAKDNEDLKDIEAAVDNAKLVEDALGEGVEDANAETEKERYTFDIKIVDAAGTEIQPEAGVQVRFALADSQKPIADANVYHLEENDAVKTAIQAYALDAAQNGQEYTNEETSADTEDYSYLDGDVSYDLGESGNSTKTYHEESEETAEAASAQLKDSSLFAQSLETTVDEETAKEVAVETEGFSYYVVEFFFATYKYVLEGDSDIELSTILDALNIKIDINTVTKVETSNHNLFYATMSQATDSEASNSVWVVKSLAPFTSEEWMKVYVYELVYEIKVTDAVLDTDVAKIGEQGYATLQAAFDAANDNDTIYLLKPLDGSVATSGFFSYTLDGTSSSKNNVTLDLGYNQMQFVELQVMGGASLNLTSAGGSQNNVSMYCTGKNSVITINSGSYVSYNMESSGTGRYCVCEAVNGGKFYIKGGEIGFEDTSQIIVGDQSSIIVTGNAIINYPKYISINHGGTMILGTPGEAFYGAVYTGNAVSIDGNMTVNSGTVDGKVALSVHNRENHIGKLVINGGTINQQILNSGYCEINGGTVLNGNTEIIKNEGTLVISYGTLGGYSVGSNTNGYITNKGDMTVTGGSIRTGTLINEGQLCINATSNVINLKGQILTRNQNSTTSITASDNSKINSQSEYVVSLQGNLVIDGGTFTNKSSATTIVSGETGTKILIKNGVFNNTNTFASMWAVSKMTLQGGLFLNVDKSVASVAFLSGKATKPYDSRYSMIIEQAECGSIRGTLSEILESAPDSSTVTILGNIWNMDSSLVDTFDISVKNKVALDMAGWKVECHSMNSTLGVIKDSSNSGTGGGGILKVPGKASITTEASNGGYMPLWDTGSQAYRFYTYNFETRSTFEYKGTLGDGYRAAGFPFVLTFNNTNAYEVISGDNADCGMQLYTRVLWNSKRYKFTYGDINLLKLYMAKQKQKGAESTQRVNFYYKVKNPSSGATMTAAAYLENGQGFRVFLTDDTFTFQ